MTLSSCGLPFMSRVHILTDRFDADSIIYSSCLFIELPDIGVDDKVLCPTFHQFAFNKSMQVFTLLYDMHVLAWSVVQLPQAYHQISPLKTVAIGYPSAVLFYLINGALCSST